MATRRSNPANWLILSLNLWINISIPLNNCGINLWKFRYISRSDYTMRTYKSNRLIATSACSTATRVDSISHNKVIQDIQVSQSTTNCVITEPHQGIVNIVYCASSPCIVHQNGERICKHAAVMPTDTSSTSDISLHEQFQLTNCNVSNQKQPTTFINSHLTCFDSVFWINQFYFKSSSTLQYKQFQ